MILSKREQNTGVFISLLAITLLLLYMGISVAGTGDEGMLLALIGAAFLCSAICCLLTLRKYRKAGKPYMIDYLNIGVQRYVLAILMALYGIDKLLGNFFDYQLFALDSKLADVSEFELAWFFYGKNHWQELFTGIMEFIPGLLLLPRKTYYVAAIILLPVTTQVFLLNLFFKIGGITLPIAAILLACNVYIIYSQKEKIVLFFRSLNFNTAALLAGRTKNMIRAFRALGICFLCLIVFAKLRPVLFKSAYQKTYQRMVGVYTLRAMKKDGIVYKPDHDSLYYKDLYLEKQDRWNILRKFDNTTEAFILKMNTGNDSISLYLNKGGIGDGADIIDSATALKGIYALKGRYLTIKGIQLKDTLELVYERQERIKPKSWFW